MRTQAVQNNGQNVQFKSLSANSLFKNHDFAGTSGATILKTLNADTAIKGISGNLEHSGTTTFITAKKGLFGKKFESALTDTKLTLDSLKETVVGLFK